MNFIPVIRHGKIVGNYFRSPAEKEAFKTLVEGEPLTLELEPTNTHDKWAVKVMKGGHHLGYVPKEYSGFFHQFGIDSVTVIAHGKGEFSVGYPAVDHA